MVVAMLLDGAGAPVPTPPDEVVMIMRLALEWDPCDRPTSFKRVAEALQKLVGALATKVGWLRGMAAWCHR